MAIFEQPLNERVRNIMRLEFLFAQADHAMSGNSQWDTRVAMETMMDILNLLSRVDIKSELLKEMERHTAYLTSLEKNPKINRSTLTAVLDELDANIDQLHMINGQIGQSLKDNEFLNMVRQRSSIPGGSCQFDLPAYHFWLMHTGQERNSRMSDWMHEFDVIRAPIRLLLSLIRESATPSKESAIGGFYQASLDPALPYQLIRVEVSDELNCFAEVSGGKHRFTVRFMELRLKDRPVQTSQDVVFKLTCCAI
jgi:cell division protein ZapD